MEGGEGRGLIFSEPDVGGSAAEGLDADGTGSGVEVDEAAGVETGGEDVEEGLAEAVAGRPSGGAFGGDEPARAEEAADDAHRAMVSPMRDR